MPFICVFGAPLFGWGWRAFQGVGAARRQPEAFAVSRLNRDEASRAPHEAMLAFHRELIALGRRLRRLANCRKDLTRVEYDEARRWIRIERVDLSGERTIVVCNLEPGMREIPLAPRPGGSLGLALSGADDGVERPLAETGDGRTSLALAGPGTALYTGGTRP